MNLRSSCSDLRIGPPAKKNYINPTEREYPYQETLKINKFLLPSSMEDLLSSPGVSLCLEEQREE